MKQLPGSRSLLLLLQQGDGVLQAVQQPLQSLQLPVQRLCDSRQAFGDVCPAAPLVVKPVGQGMHCRCFFRPGPYESTGHGTAEMVLLGERS